MQTEVWYGSLPIESIWTNGIKGTKDIQKLEPPNDGSGRGYPVLRAINHKLIRDDKADERPAIVVAGKPSEVVEKILEVTKGEIPVDPKFTTADELNFFFYTNYTQSYLVLDAIYIKRTNRNVLHIDYHLVSHATEEIDAWIGIIPLGKLPAGEYVVSFHRNKTINEKGDNDGNFMFGERQMCRPISIQINKE